MRIAFLGTPDVSAVVLEALVGAGHDVAVVVTRPDKRRGRGCASSPSPVKAAAQRLGLPVAHEPRDVLGKGADLGVVVAYGRLVKAELLAEMNFVNLHFSLLPRWRGAAPVERAILAGDDLTGVCLMQLEEGLDTGPIYDCAKVKIGEDENAVELRARLAALGAKMLLACLGEGFPPPVPQAGEPTSAPKLSPPELRLDFSRPALACHRVVRAGRAWTIWRGKRLLVHRARVVEEGRELSPGEIKGTSVGTSAGALQLVSVQPEGRATMGAADWARGARLLPGERLGD